MFTALLITRYNIFVYKLTIMRKILRLAEVTLYIITKSQTRKHLWMNISTSNHSKIAIKCNPVLYYTVTAIVPTQKLQ